MTYRHQLMKIALVWFLAVVTQACRCGTASSSSSAAAAAAVAEASGFESSSLSLTPPLSSSSSSSSSYERINVIKSEILNKLGMNDAPDLADVVARSNATEEERRRIARLYDRTHRRLRAKTHNVTTPGEERAKQFYTFTAVQHADNFVKTKKSKKGIRVYFDINIHRTADRDKEIQVTEASLRLFKNRKYIRELRRTEDSVRLKIYQLIPRTSKDFKDNTMTRNISVNANNRTQLVNAKTNAIVDSSRNNNNNNGANRRKLRRFGRRLVQSRLVSLASSSSSPSFEEFDVLKSARDWIADASSNHGFLITMESADHHRLRDVIRLQQQQQQPTTHRKRRKSRTGSSKKNKNRKRLPQLNIFVREEAVRSSRGKRSATEEESESGDCRLGDGENRCCRFSTWISFADIGWSDWIIAPAGFLARFCDGTCPPHYRPANRFASVKELVRAAAALRPAAAASAAAATSPPPPPPPPACCSATRMSALPIAHYNHDGVAVISIFEDLVVEECRCA